MDNQNIDPTEYREPMKADASRPPRGKLKIFFCYAAGVGKTYAMLEGAHAQKVQGVDVVIGYVETHGCIETELLLNGLQVLPWRVVNGNQALHTEFDLDAALARRPALILIDELAHTNAGGVTIARIEQRLHLGLPVGVEILGELRRHDHGYGTIAVVNLLDDVFIVIRNMDDFEIFRGLEMLQQILAGLG